MRKFTKAAAMLCAAAMVIPSASVFAAEDGGASELTEVGTYPISEEPLEFTMFRTNMPNVEDFQTNDFTKYMEDLTNIKFTFEAAARDDRAEKLNMEFNTNTYPDVIMHYAPDATMNIARLRVFVEIHAGCKNCFFAKWYITKRSTVKLDIFSRKD